MSFLTTVRTALAPRLATTPLRPAMTSALHTSAPRAGLNESDRNRDDLDKIYEEHKNDQLKHSKQGTAKWKQELASNSEASVKADRGDIDSDDKDFATLQERTKGLPNRAGNVNKTQ
ncbi:uncharacterized protein BO66DRAFT_434998 [Aspergillus aculeatinus CBS 121060]|uniref:Uncharacterized protein n=1 Tax=Aspergillus aculeatinus CBS 121060 TaxID=1448322 RepID=A0ACD1HK70_9EURO|nr:hypothetical protein BO66DRAFT_434998 [Aspergillus aculeatinus CBS 121060]RAH74009.1 hypothetical protein BO66DRAFT_434998 [Aspergillus aculeatinus CBS 121060]